MLALAHELSTRTDAQATEKALKESNALLARTSEDLHSRSQELVNARIKQVQAARPASPPAIVEAKVASRSLGCACSRV